MSSVLLAMLIARAAAEGGWVRQAEGVCFSARERADAELFQANVTGIIGGVRFVHKNGSVSCGSGAPLTNFGCSQVLGTLLISEAAGAVMYPSAMTEYTSIVDYIGTDLHWYQIPSRLDGDMLILKRLLYEVQRGEVFRVEYSEVFADYTLSDNRGTACVDVDFLVIWNSEENVPLYDAGTTGVTEVLMQ